MAEKTFISQFTVPKQTGGNNNLTPTNTHPSIVCRHGYVFVAFINNADARVKVGIYDRGTDTFNSYYVDPVADWTVSNDGHYLATLGIDNDGYLHLTAHMAQYPRYIDPAMPARYQSGANCMYFKSDSPYDPSSWTFYGNQPAYTIPGKGFNNVKFIPDNNGVLYAVSRIEVHDTYTMGIKGLGISVYDTTTKTWTAKGVAPHADEEKAVVWVYGGDSDSGNSAYQGFYNSIYFDSQNRMHLATEAFVGSEPNASTVLYGYSDDGGDTWKRADGTNILMPIGNATGDELTNSGTLENQSCNIIFDSSDNPIVLYFHDGAAVFRRWNGSAWTAETNTAAQYAPNSRGYNYSGLNLLVNAFSFGSQFRTTNNISTTDDYFTLTEQLQNIDISHLRDTVQELYAVSVNSDPLEYGYLYIGTAKLFAHAGPDQQVSEAIGQVTVEGSRSYDQDPLDSIVSYSWTQQSGPNTATIVSASSAQTVISGLIAGDYVFRLTVTDGDTNTAYDDITITVSQVVNLSSGIRSMIAVL